MFISKMTDDELIFKLGECVMRKDNPGYDIAQIRDELKYRQIIVDDNESGNCWRVTGGKSPEYYEGFTWRSKGNAWLFWTAVSQPANTSLSLSVNPVKILRDMTGNKVPELSLVKELRN